MTHPRKYNTPMTAGEILRELEQDPEYVAGIQERKRQELENVERYRRAAEPLVNELRATGARVNTIRDLRDGTDYGPVVLSTLLRWLPRISDPAVKEDIVRTLSVPWAKPAAAQALIDEFKKADDRPGLQWAIANGLEVVADDSVFDELVSLAQDKRYGRAREMLALALGNFRNPRAIETLIHLLDDDDTVGHAVAALGKMRATAARTRLGGLMGHPNKWVRREVKKALARIEKRSDHR